MNAVVTDTRGPSRSGSRAPPMRSTRHTALYTANRPPDPDSPSERAWSGRNAREHGEGGHPDGEDDSGADGVRMQPARRRTACSIRGATIAGANASRRGTVVDTSAAPTANSPARANALRKPDVLSITSPTIGPMPMPAVHGDREVRRGLRSAVGRAEVGDQRHRGDEQGGLARAGEPAQHEKSGSESTKPYAVPAPAARAAPPIITARRP